MQRVVLIPDRHFGTTCWSHLQGLSQNVGKELPLLAT